MLKHTFCHLAGIGPKTERRLWSRGITSWDVALGGPCGKRPCPDELRESMHHHANGNPRFFADRLAAREHWRLFPDFRHACLYLDIETTGMVWGPNAVTTIATYDGAVVRHYIQGVNLDRFPEDVRGCKVLVTYNGKQFDLPFLERTFGMAFEQAHVDLRYVLAALGYRGGLKGCEKQLGVARPESHGMDGWVAVGLWHEFRAHGNDRALESLLAYNVEDVINLETLLVLACNARLQGTPFEAAYRLPLPAAVPNPFRVDRATVERVMAGGWGPRPFRPLLCGGAGPQGEERA